jgi:AhpD family alkylhydroperoxidase
MASTAPAAEQLVAAIRREEQTIAEQRARSSIRRSILVERLAVAVGSHAEAARRMGVSQQAVSKALAAAADPGILTPSVEFIGVRLGKFGRPGYGVDVPTVQEWEAVEDRDESLAAALRGLAAWDARYNVLVALERMLGFLADGCQEVLEADEADTASSRQVREIILEGWDELVQYLPATRRQARIVGDFARLLSPALGDAGGLYELEAWRRAVERAQERVERADTTTYLDWADANDGGARRLHQYLEIVLRAQDLDPGRYDLDAMAMEYGDAIRAQLPEGVVFTGGAFLGAAPRPAGVREMIRAAVARADLWAIIASHDPDAPTA